MGARNAETAGLRLVKEGCAEADEVLDDVSLVERALTGERKAEELLVRRHVGELTRVVAHMLGSSQETDDVVQDTLVIALEKLDRLQKPAAFRSWLLCIGVNEVRRVFRRRKLRRALGLEAREECLGLDSFAASGASPEVRAELMLLAEALRRLPADERIAWSLRYVEGYALDEVAEACGCSLATAKRRISAAHQRVRALITIEEDGLG